MMDGIDVGVLTQHAGPFNLPVWAYGAIGGAALLVISKVRKGASANTTFGSGVQNPNYLPVASGSAAPALLAPIGVGQNAAYDPNSGQIVEASNPFGTTFFDNLGKLFGGLPNAPNTATVTGPNGYMFTFGNNVATYGNGAGLQSGAVGLQNSVNQGLAISGFWDAWKAQIQGYWDTANTAVQNGQQLGAPSGNTQGNVNAILYQGGYPGASPPVNSPSRTPGGRT